MVPRGKVGSVSERRVVGFDGADSFRRLYDAAFPRVYAYLLQRSGAPSVAQDLAQETFMAAVRELNAGRGEQMSLPWLMGVARHKLVDHYRRCARDERRLRRAWVLSVRDRDDEDLDDGSPSGRALQALRLLPPTQQAALVLHHLDDLAVTEVADLLGKSVRATESLLARARDGFRRNYGPREGDE